MKKLLIMSALLLLVSMISIAQQNAILKSHYKTSTDIDQKGPFINDSLVKELVNEYLVQAEYHGLNLKEHINNINEIIIEPESNQPQELIGLTLAKIDKERKLILLSRLCLLDKSILHIVLFRELSHYIGVPYDLEMVAFMNPDKKYRGSYAWITEPLIKEIEYKSLFEVVLKYSSKP